LVLEKTNNRRHKQRTIYKCKCDCGNIVYVPSNSLITGNTKSCGCLFIEHITLHGMTKTREYNSWQSMLSRCNNPKNMQYRNYGGRGITVCDEWKNSFENFLKDMGERPENTSLDRIDVNGNYSPNNCRWATKAEQARNKRQTIWITFDEKTQCLTDWANEIGISSEGLRYRLKNTTVNNALTKPVDTRFYSEKKRHDNTIY